LELDSAEAISPGSDNDIDTNMDTDSDAHSNMTNTLLLQAVLVGTKFMFVQEHRTLGILVVSILSLEVPVD
jgi:hypothetical protein